LGGPHGAFRTPNVDERLLLGARLRPFFNPLPVDFRLKTQTSHDIEGGVRIKSGPLEVQSSIYNMDLENELQFNPIQRFNVNLDPTAATARKPARRFVSAIPCSCAAAWPIPARCSRRAICRQRRSAGVRYTGSAGVSWKHLQNYLGRRRHRACWSERFMDKRPGQYPAPDSSERYGRFQAERRIRALSSGQSPSTTFLNALYYDYAVESLFTPGRFSAYPLPGRAYMVKAGATF
jgi:iron complex outermembrane receptor protein